MYKYVTPPETPERRVLVAAYRASVRRCLRRFLDTTEGVTTAAEAKDPNEGLVLVEDLWPKRAFDVVVVSLADAFVEGRGLITALGEDHPDVPVLAVDERESPYMCDLVLELGALGYVSREGHEGEMLLALEAVAAGRRYAPIRNREQRRLSRQEVYVVREFAAGKHISDIAAALDIEDSTAHTYKRRAKHKLGCMTDADLIRYAIRSGLC